MRLKIKQVQPSPEVQNQENNVVVVGAGAGAAAPDQEEVLKTAIVKEEEGQEFGGWLISEGNNNMSNPENNDPPELSLTAPSVAQSLVRPFFYSLSLLFGMPVDLFEFVLDLVLIDRARGRGSLRS